MIPFPCRRPDLLKEWSPRNSVDPYTVGCANKKYKALWICEYGHEWEKTVQGRVNDKTNCAVCAGKRVLAGYNDIKSQYPELYDEWNDPRNIVDFTTGSGYKATWKCSTCSHVWKALIVSRTHGGSGCPACRGRVANETYNLNILYPEISEEIFDGSDPHTITPRSSKKIKWKCKNGHVWTARVSDRTDPNKGTGCPYCSGKRIIEGINDFSTLRPEIAIQWSRCNARNPNEFSEKSNYIAKWTCPREHTWSATIVSRTDGGNGCPYCFGRYAWVGETDLATTHPDVAAEWHPSNDKTAKDVTAGSHCKVMWVCSKGHTQTQVVRERIKSRCATCSRSGRTSEGERELVDYVTSILSGEYVETSVRHLKGVREVDLYVPNRSVALEYNGVYYHSTAIRKPTFHYDKYKKCLDIGVDLIQVWEDDWKSKPIAVKNMLNQKFGLIESSKTLRVCEFSKSKANSILDAYSLLHDRKFTKYFSIDDDSGNNVGVCAITNNTTSITLYVVAYRCSYVSALTESVKKIQHMYGLPVYVENDLCHSFDKQIKSAGLTVSKTVTPDFMYLRSGKRLLRSETTKDYFKNDKRLSFDSTKSVDELAQSNKLHRVYDAGKMIYTTGT